MGRLDDITLEELQELREQTEGEIPRERVLAAIGRKQGDELETTDQAAYRNLTKKKVRSISMSGTFRRNYRNSTR
jgi:hypothetical protein